MKIVKWILNCIFCIRYWVARTRHPEVDWDDDHAVMDYFHPNDIL